MSYESSDPAKDQLAPPTSPSAIGVSVNRRCHVKTKNEESRRHHDASLQKNVINNGSDAKLLIPSDMMVSQSFHFYYS